MCTTYIFCLPFFTPFSLAALGTRHNHCTTRARPAWPAIPWPIPDRMPGGTYQPGTIKWDREMMNLRARFHVRPSSFGRERPRHYAQKYGTDFRATEPSRTTNSAEVGACVRIAYLRTEVPELRTMQQLVRVCKYNEGPQQPRNNAICTTNEKRESGAASAAAAVVLTSLENYRFFRALEKAHRMSRERVWVCVRVGQRETARDNFFPHWNDIIVFYSGCARCCCYCYYCADDANQVAKTCDRAAHVRQLYTAVANRGLAYQ